MISKQLNCSVLAFSRLLSTIAAQHAKHNGYSYAKSATEMWSFESVVSGDIRLVKIFIRN